MLPRKSLPHKANITNYSTNNSNNTVNPNIINSNKPLIPKIKCNLQAKIVLEDIVSAIEKSDNRSYADVVNGVKKSYISSNYIDCIDNVKKSIYNEPISPLSAYRDISTKKDRISSILNINNNNNTTNTSNTNSTNSTTNSSPIININIDNNNNNNNNDNNISSHL